MTPRALTVSTGGEPIKDKSETHEFLKKEAVSVPPATPPSEYFERSAEKIYLSLLEEEKRKDVLGTCGNVEANKNVEIVETVRKKEEEYSREIHKRINGVIAPKRRYRKNVIRDRCRQFTQDLEAEDFRIGHKLRKSELRYWIITLDLAHDKSTVKQYMERLVIYGYFFLHKNGLYEFAGSLPPGQVALLDPKIVRYRLQASLSKPKKVKSY